MRALIVDDSKAMRLILGRTLRELGFDITESGDGRQALELLNRGEEISLMLVDWNMPVMNGYDFVRAVRANALLADVRIMMVTTETSLANVEKALAAGANEYLMKPFTRELLVEKLALLGLN
ncbi:MAG: response regulator [Opitutaceae bacterium]|nr:response regulator [Opitutaceae bacterium]